MFRTIKFLQRIYQYRSVIVAMAVREIRSRYIGTFAGLLWSIINPLMMVLVYWFVFSVGFKVRPTGNVPFIVVFLCGLIPWLAFSEALATSANALNANAHLVTKTVFPTEILPLVYLLASLITHVIMLIILLVVLLFNELPLSIYSLQFLYYFFAMSVFALGLGWIVSAANVFWKDVGQCLGVILNVWFWFTPIVWDISIMHQKYQFIIKLNPFYYVVEGYRASFVYQQPIWHNYRMGIYFWVVCTFVFVAGAFIFRKLKPEFAEVL
ncbi:MAG: ABC transporter permease [Anaerohalosphaeraceae bacterium]|nr:ABC transporter permease [Anaerohalosphaeraceae bacterium]